MVHHVSQTFTRENRRELFCQTCGNTMAVQLPMALDQYAAILNQFSKLHEYCVPAKGGA